jgi:2-oxoglutarate ferredoxin oxidoreductase subunit delta
LCPKQVLGRNDEGGPVVVDPDACIGCGWCELHCPDFAISVRPRPEKEEATS